MTYRVELTSRADRDLSSLFLQINAVDSRRARDWYFGLRDAILSLAQMPNRNPVTPENKRLRHLLYRRKPHVYRIIFRVRKKAGRVEILHIRHGARQKFRAADLE